MKREDYLVQRRSQIAHNLREARQGYGWSQEQVADYLHCSRRRVNRAEQGHTELGVVELELLAQAFEVPLSRILGTAV